jgi:hypothetical protein
MNIGNKFFTNNKRFDIVNMLICIRGRMFI